MPFPFFATGAARHALHLALSVTIALAATQWAAPAQAQTESATGNAASAAQSYKAVNLGELVDKSRTEIAGQRIIFVPTPVKFEARLSALPAPQKAEYLQSALAMMKVSTVPKVSQRIGLDYGGDKSLAAYIEDGTAQRLGKSAKLGQTLTFYALHVYNNNRGPALVVTSFAE